MAFGRKIYEEACRELKNRKDMAERTALEKREQFYLLCPQAKDLKEDMASNAARAATTVLSGGNVREELTRLRERGMAYKAQYEALLRKQGLSPEDLEPKYSCKLCKDTGAVDGRMCQCLKALQKSLAYEKLCTDFPLGDCTFENYSLEYFRQEEAVYRRMETIYQGLRTYAEKLSPRSQSMLLYGATGLGKTHLSLAVAGVGISKGMSVIYGSVQTFAVGLERERFRAGEEEEGGDTQMRLISCELLVLDDLGAEFPSAYVSAALYNVLDSRLMAQRPTVISTNLNLREIEKRYGERLVSRVMGNYQVAEFLGKDVRYLKRVERQTGPGTKDRGRENAE